jgi:hypothetical protein
VRRSRSPPQDIACAARPTAHDTGVIDDTIGGVDLGSRAIMVREDFGRRSEYELAAFEPGRRVAMRHPNAAMLFELEFALAPAAHSTGR